MFSFFGLKKPLRPTGNVFDSEITVHKSKQLQKIGNFIIVHLDRPSTPKWNILLVMKSSGFIIKLGGLAVFLDIQIGIVFGKFLSKSLS